MAELRSTPGPGGDRLGGALGVGGSVFFRQGAQRRDVIVPERVPHRDRECGKIGLAGPGQDTLAEFHPARVRGIGVMREAQPVMGRNRCGVRARERQQEFGFREVAVMSHRHQMADQVEFVAFGQRREQLGGQVAVAVLDLVEVFDAVAVPRFAAGFLASHPPPLQNIGADRAAHEKRCEPAPERGGIHGRGPALVLELLRHCGLLEIPASEGSAGALMKSGPGPGVLP